MSAEIPKKEKQRERELRGTEQLLQQKLKTEQVEKMYTVKCTP